MRALLRKPWVIIVCAFIMGWTLGSADNLATWLVCLLALCGGFIAAVWADWDR